MQSWIDGDGSKEQIEIKTSHVRNPQEGKKLTIGALQVTVKATGAETGGNFGLVEVTVPPYFADIWPHLHKESSEAIFITQGMLALTLGEGTDFCRAPGELYLYPSPTGASHLESSSNRLPSWPTLRLPGAEEFFEALAGMALPLQSARPNVVADVWALGMSFDHFPAS